MPKNEEQKCRAMANTRKYPTSNVRSGRVLCRYNEIESYPRTNLTYFQNNVIHNFKAMEDETLYEELPSKHTHTHTHTHIRTRDGKLRPGGPAGLKIQAGPGFFAEPGLRALALCRARERRLQCIVHWLPGFVGCLKDGGRARCWAQQISCGAGLGSGLDFGDFFCTSNTYALTDLKRQFMHPFIQMKCYNFSYVYYRFSSRYASIAFPFPASQSSPEHPHLARPEPPPIMPRQYMAWRFVSRREFSRM